MTHFDGYMNGYQTAFSFYSCCNHDAGLELLRTFSGENWLFETKVSYFMPFANGRFMPVRVYFGDGGVGTTYVNFVRVRDGPFPSGTPETTPVAVQLNQKLVPPLPSGGQPVSILESESVSPNPSGDVYYFRVERAGSILTAMWSYDGVTWNTTFSRDMGTDLDGLTQLVAVTGLSWFVPASSFAEYDYISVTPTNEPPVAEAGPDQTVFVGETVQLDGSASSDPDSDPLTFDWEIVDAPVGNAAIISDASIVDPTFVPDVAGEYVIQLIVNDGLVDSDPDQVTITAQTPAQATEDVIDELGNLVEADPGSPLADKLGDVIDKLQTALDELNKTPPDNQAAVGAIEGAVGDVEAAVKDGLLDAAQGTEIMDELAGVARQLAESAIEDATARGGDPGKIIEAEDALAEGDALRDAGAFKDAVNKYKDALAKAEGA
jgi:hypothetical protein